MSCKNDPQTQTEHNHIHVVVYGSHFSLSALAADAHQSAFAVRAGDDITVPCGNVTGGQGDCDGTVWTFRGSAGAAELVAPAQSHGPVTGSCSLVIEKVSLEDAGRYTCRRSKAGSAGGSEVHVDLAVVHSECSHLNVSHLKLS